MAHPHDAPRGRLRDLGVAPGVLSPGPLNAITDVAGVRVGHLTLIAGEAIRTGATAILPHAGNLFQERVPAGLAVGNGFGKLAGATQLVELGELETPVVLTNTLAVPRAADALIGYTLARPGNEDVRSVNPLVGECNDGYLNDIRARALTGEHVLAAIAAAAGGPVAEGCVGAGTGVVAFGWKGGVGTSSRRLPASLGGYTVGALAQANFGGVLQVDGLAVGRALGRYFLRTELDRGDADGSVIIVLASDAPLSDRSLTRLARRGLAGLARTGAAMSDGSGDYALAFSTNLDVRRRQGLALHQVADLANAAMSPLFLAAIEAAEEAVYNALCAATTMTGWRGHTVEALPLEQVAEMARLRRTTTDE